MRQYFSPGQIFKWSDEDFANLVGKYVVVEVPATDWYKEHVPDGGDWEGGSGICTEAGFRDAYGTHEGPIPKVMFVNFDYGMGWHWLPSVEAHISVCDEHGEHKVKYSPDGYVDTTDPGASECLGTLGVRGKSTIRSVETRKEDGGGEEETSKGSAHKQIR